MERVSSQFQKMTDRANGPTWIKEDCYVCWGKGLVLDGIGEPDECSRCGGSGTTYQHKSMPLTKAYPSGPFISR